MARSCSLRKCLRAKCAAALFFSLALAATLAADTVSWVGGSSGAWADPANWSGGDGWPDSLDTLVSFDSASASVDLEGGSYSIQKLESASSVSLTLKGGTITTSSTGSFSLQGQLTLEDMTLRGYRVYPASNKRLTFAGENSMTGGFHLHLLKDSSYVLFQNGVTRCDTSPSVNLAADSIRHTLMFDNARFEAVSVSNKLGKAFTHVAFDISIRLGATNGADKAVFACSGPLTIYSKSTLAVDASGFGVGVYPLVTASPLSAEFATTDIVVDDGLEGRIAISDSAVSLVVTEAAPPDPLYVWLGASHGWTDDGAWSNSSFGAYPSGSEAIAVFAADEAYAKLNGATYALSSLTNSASLTLDGGTLAAGEIVTLPGAVTKFRDMNLSGPGTLAVGVGSTNEFLGSCVLGESLALDCAGGSTLRFNAGTVMFANAPERGEAPALHLDVRMGSTNGLPRASFAGALDLGGATLSVNARGIVAGTYPLVTAARIANSAELASSAQVSVDGGCDGTLVVDSTSISLVVTGVRTNDWSSVDVRLNEAQSVNDATAVDDLGHALDWVELWNAGEDDVDLTGWGLSDKKSKPFKYVFPAGTTIAAGGYLVVWADADVDASSSSQPHACFSLSSGGESVYLTRPDSVVADTLAVPPLKCDTSYGPCANTRECAYFRTPTPGAANAAEAFSAPLGPVRFSVERGLYETNLTLTLSHDDPEARIYYTLDHSDPSEANGILYDGGEIAITNTTVVRSTAVKDGALAVRNIVSHSYIYPLYIDRQQKPECAATTWSDSGSCAASYGVSPSVIVDDESRAALAASVSAAPIVSITLGDGEFFDPSTGLHSHPWTQLNTGEERAVSVEWLNSADTNLVFGTDAALRMQGNYSRKFGSTPKKGFRLIFRSRYGASHLERPVLSDRGYGRDIFKSLVLRPEHNDSWPTGSAGGNNMKDQFFRDLQLAMSGYNLGGSHVQLFINGLYWGLYNITEHADEDAMVERFGGLEEDWSMHKKRETDTTTGDITVFTNMMARLYAAYSSADSSIVGNAEKWAASRNGEAGAPWVDCGVDFSTAEGYAEAAAFANLTDFADYMILGYYSGNTDWPYNNWIAAGAPKSGVPFRWLTWDFELAYASAASDKSATYSVKYERSPQYFQRALERSSEYRLLFADRLARHFADGGPLATDELVRRYNELADRVRPLVFAESARWGAYQYDYNAKGSVLTTNNWESVRKRVVSDIIPARRSVFLGHMSKLGLWPNIAAPALAVSDDALSLTCAAVDGATVYYTTDGSDPRTPWTGAVGASAATWPSEGAVVASAPTSSVVRVRALGDDGEWSAISEATLARSPGADNRFLPTTNGEKWDDDANWSAGAFPDAAGSRAVIGEPTKFKSGKNWRNVKIDSHDVTVGTLRFENGGCTNRITSDATGGSIAFDGGEGAAATIAVDDALGAGMAMIDLDAPHVVGFSGELELAVANVDGDDDYGALYLKGCWAGAGTLVKTGLGRATLAVTNAAGASLGDMRVDGGTLAFEERVAIGSLAGAGTADFALSSSSATGGAAKAVFAASAANVAHVRLFVNPKSSRIVYGGCAAAALSLDDCEVFVRDEEGGEVRWCGKTYRAEGEATVTAASAGDALVYRVALPGATPVVGGEETDPAEVFLSANSKTPVEYPYAPVLAGEIGAQTVTFGATVANVPAHYTAKCDGTTLTLELNENAAPTIRGEKGVPALEFDGERLRVHAVPGCSADLFYSLGYSDDLNATAEGWTLGEWLPTCDLDAPVGGNMRFYRVFVRDY